jgi:hypothetical protein
MIYPYRPQRRGNETRYLPLIPLEMHNARRHLRVRALIDSGAEQTVFSTQLADELGIEYLNNRSVMLQGIGGIVRGYLATVDLTLGTYRWTTSAIFAESIGADSGMLGQLGFFEFFTVVFRYRGGEIDVRRARTQ